MKAWGVTLRPDRAEPIRATKAPLSRSADALEQAGRRVRELQRQITAREVDRLVVDEVTCQFATLLDIIGDHRDLGDDLREQIGLIAGILGLELPR